MQPAPPKLLLGLIGSGIGKSMTPAMQEEEGRAQGLRVHYQLIDLAAAGATVADMPQLISAMRIIGFDGFNVTFPCKQAIVPLLDDLSDAARAMGAVNTVVRRDGRLIGHNTDGAGWAWGFQRALPQADLARVVLLGGAGAAIADAALRLGVQHLIVVDVDGQRSAALADKLNDQRHGRHLAPGTVRVTASTDIAAAMAGATGLIHATPTGMAASPGLPLAPGLLGPGVWVSEIVYFPLDTALLQEARARGCAVSDGGGMAVGQAVGAFALFTGRKADADRVDAHFRSMVAPR